VATAGPRTVEDAQLLTLLTVMRRSRKEEAADSRGHIDDARAGCRNGGFVIANVRHLWILFAALVAAAFIVDGRRASREHPSLVCKDPEASQTVVIKSTALLLPPGFDIKTRRLSDDSLDVQIVPTDGQHYTTDVTVKLMPADMRLTE
jgi:hypothetical protein